VLASLWVARDMSSSNLDRRRFLKYAGAGVVCGAVAGVGGYVIGAQSGVTTLPSTTAAVTETITQTATPSENTIRLGVACDISGFGGKQTLEGAKLAVKEINAMGGVLRRNLELVVEDTREEQTGATAEDQIKAATKLVVDDHVNAFIAGFGTPVNLMSVSADNKAIYIDPSGADMNVNMKIAADYERYKYVFQATIVNADFGIIAADFVSQLAKQMGEKEVAVMGEDLDWVHFNYQYAKPAFEQNGVAVGETVFTPVGETDYSAALAKIRASKARLVYLIYCVANTVPLLKKYSALQLPFVMAGYDCPSANLQWWEQTGGACNYEVPYLPIVQSPLTKRTIPFYEAYNKEYGATPQYTSASTYSAIYIYADAVARAGTTDPEALVPALEQTDLICPTGRNVFTKDHYLLAGPEYVSIYFSQWQDGKLITVYPEAAAQGSVKLPPWMK